MRIRMFVFCSFRTVDLSFEMHQVLASHAGTDLNRYLGRLFLALFLSGLCFLFSLAAGVLLSALASMQPSWSASRMAPMEAMRVE